MLYRDICKVLGYYLFGLMVTLLVPFFLAAYYQFFTSSSFHPQPHSTFAFFWSITLSGLLGALCFYIGRNSTGHLYRREGLISVVLIWFLTPAIAGAPFFFSGTLKDPAFAYFEAASGFTTTGSSMMQAKAFDPTTGEEIPIIQTLCGIGTTEYKYWGTIEPVRDPKSGEILYEGIEAVSRALLFWRSFTQWLGGMGIVVLFVAVLPALGVGGKVLFQAEVPGPIKDSLTPRIKETAIHLWKIYTGLSLLQIVLLMITNKELGLYDAVTITFSTMATGGFSPKNASIGAFDNAYTDWVVIIFMIIAAVNFSLYYYALQGKFYRFYEPEFFLFLILLLIGWVFTVWFLVSSDTKLVLLTGETKEAFSFEEALRYGAFQLTSAMTSTGFVTADFNFWPPAIQTLMLIFMFIGGMSGSTAGGMKVIRQYMLFKIGQHKVESLFRPESVRSFKLGEREVDRGAALTVLVFFLIVISIATLSTFVFIVDGVDPESSIALTGTLMNNIGLGFRAASTSCAFLSDFGVIYSSLLMIFGRLEFLAVLAVMVPAFWKTNK